MRRTHVIRWFGATVGTTYLVIACGSSSTEVVRSEETGLCIAATACSATAMAAHGIKIQGGPPASGQPCDQCAAPKCCDGSQPSGTCNGDLGPAPPSFDIVARVAGHKSFPSDSTTLFSLGWAVDNETMQDNSNDGCTAKRKNKLELSGDAEGELEGPLAAAFAAALPWVPFNGLAGDVKVETKGESTNVYASPKLCCGTTTAACGELLDSDGENESSFGGHLFGIRDLAKGKLGPLDLELKLALGGGATFTGGDKRSNKHEEPECPNPAPPDDGSDSTTWTLQGDVQAKLIGSASAKLFGKGVCVTVTASVKGCAKGSLTSTDTWPPQPPNHTQTSSGPVVGAIADLDITCDGQYCDGDKIRPGLCTTVGDKVCIGFGWLAICFGAHHSFDQFDPDHACSDGSVGSGGAAVKRGIPTGGVPTTSSGGQTVFSGGGGPIDAGSGDGGGSSAVGCGSMSYMRNTSFTTTDIPIDGALTAGTLRLTPVGNAAVATLNWAGGTTVPIYTGSIFSARAAKSADGVILAINAARSDTDFTNVLVVAFVRDNASTVAATQTITLPCASMADIGVSVLTGMPTVRYSTVDAPMFAPASQQSACSGLAWNGASLVASNGQCTLGYEDGASVSSVCYTGNGVVRGGVADFSGATPVCAAGQTCVSGIDGQAHCGCTPYAPDQCSGGTVCLLPAMADIGAAPTCQTCAINGTGGAPGECCDVPCPAGTKCGVDAHGLPTCN